MTASVKAVGDHYLHYLGTPRNLLTARVGAGHAISLGLLEYIDTPYQGATSIVTLGLSTAPLHVFGEELIFSCYSQFMHEELYDLLAAVANEVATSQHPLYRGEVLSLEKPISGTQMSNPYIYPPTMLPDGFEPIPANETEVVTHIAWLIPIYECEAHWLKEKTSGAFEDLLETCNPDLLDLARPAIV